MSSPIATVTQGKLKGYVGTDINGKEFYKFSGIPYARPPVGELRFKAPEPAESWTGIRDATKEGDRCYSRDEFRREIVGSEDCLYLNVYTTELPDSSSELKPVMVYIHGGAFTLGSGSSVMYGPEFLITGDVVLVTLNYRVGILGFLSLEDTSLQVPGNAGLKDQTMALKWVQENIRSFNGDPNNVTIFGESAGGASVHFQILSPASKGLFHKAIAQSGSSLCGWAWGSRNAIDIANKLGKQVTNEKEALEILMYTPHEKLYEIQETIGDPLDSGKRRQFSPVIEKPNGNAFLTRDPLELIDSGEYNQVPTIFGYTSREGMLIEFQNLFANEVKQSETKPLSPEDGALRQLELEPESDEYKILKEKLHQLYFSGPDEKDNDYVIHTDSMFLVAIMESIRRHVKTAKNPIYLFRMSVESKLNILKGILKIQQPGAAHGDDIGYLFKNMATPELEPGSLEEKSVQRFVKLFTDFAKYGNPTPTKELGITWEPVIDENNITYLEIGEELSVGTNPEPERNALWRSILEKHPFSSHY